MDNNNGCIGKIVFLTIVVLIIIGVVAYALLHQPSDYEYAQQQLSLARAETLQPWTIALGIALRIVAIVGGIALLLALVATIQAGVRWLDTRSRLIHPSAETGQFPAVKVRRGEAVVDLNRLPDGRAVTGVLGGRSALLLTLFFRYVLGKDVPEFQEQPAILVTQADTSPEQLRVTTQAQATQALAAASRHGEPGQVAQAVQMLAAPPAGKPQGLPPLLVRGTEPREVKLLLDAARQEWEQDVIDGDTVDLLPSGRGG